MRRHGGKISRKRTAPGKNLLIKIIKKAGYLEKATEKKWKEGVGGGNKEKT